MIVWYYFHVSLVWTTLKKRFIIHSFGAVCVYFGVCVCVCGLLLCRRTGVQYITTALFSKVLVHVRRVQCVHGKSHQVKAQCDPFSSLIQKADRLDSSQCGQNISMTLIFCEVANMLRLTTRAYCADWTSACHWAVLQTFQASNIVVLLGPECCIDTE